MVNSAMLTRDNHCMVYPVLRCGDHYILEPGWEIKGETIAPYPNRLGGETKAVVFEKTSPATESNFDMLADLQPGVYWCHGELDMFDLKRR